MWSRVVTRGCGVLVAALGLSGPARADDRAGPFIWYRNAEGCPDGDAFLSKLRARGVEGHVARVGDPVDFVVTLGGGQEGARGLLERQTVTGTVAVRELDGTDCEQVADGIALVLAMARESTPARPPAATEAPPTPKAAPNAPTAKPARAGSVPRAARADAVWAVGAQAGVLFGLTPAALPNGGPFVELDPGRSLRTAAFRAYVFGGSASEGQLSTTIIAGRLEGCPLTLSVGSLSLTPCAAIDLGGIQAKGTGPNALKDLGFWGAAEVSARPALEIWKSFSLEIQVAALIPFQRYQLTSEASATPLYVASPVGLNATFGVRLRLP